MQVFTIAPASLKRLWVLAPIIVVLALVGALLAVSLLGSRGARFEVSEAGLRIHGDFYGRVVPAHAMRVADARRVDLAATRDLQPRLRTLGTGLPGYQSGWFRLRNGEKALLYLTDRGKAVYVPTTEGYSLLVSPADPDGFLSALRGVAR